MADKEAMADKAEMAKEKEAMADKKPEKRYGS